MILAASYGSVANDIVILFISMLAVLAQVFVVAVALLSLASAFAPAARRLLDSLALRFHFVAIPLAFVVSLTAMLGSLYFSLVIGWTPCNMCWYQRTTIYPLAVILGVATFMRRRDVTPYALALALLCLPLSTYHYLLEWYPQLESSVCDINVPCSAVYLRVWEYLSIPLMAGTCALTVITLLLLERRAHKIRETQTNPN